MSKKRVPYISFSINKLPAFLDLIKEKEPIDKDLLVSEASREFVRSKKTIQEFVISMKNLGLVEEKNGQISLTEISQTILGGEKDRFWGILREGLLKDEPIANILQAIVYMSGESIKVKSNDEYYHKLSEVLQRVYGFESASPRELDRFITLFRRIKALDYDPFSDEYFIVRKHDISKSSLEKIAIEKYEQVKDIVIKKTGTLWVPVDLLRSRICREEGIEVSFVDRFLRNAIEENRFQFAEASASRSEVRKGGIKKGDKIYYYVKMTGD